MSVVISTAQSTTSGSDACYEAIASQEEIYLEEVEEELRAILILESPCPSENVDQKLERAAEDLVTGDSDDPPLSEPEITELFG
jgi:hypothetical protein